MSKLLSEADRIYAQHGLSPVGITELEQLIARDTEVWGETVKIAAYQAMLTAQHRLRRRVEGNTVKVYSAEMQESVQTACASWYSWPMMDGTPIGKATRSHLERDAERYKKNARGNVKKANFLFSVAERLGAGQTVDQVLTEAELASLLDA